MSLVSRLKSWIFISPHATREKGAQHLYEGGETVAFLKVLMLQVPILQKNCTPA